MFYVIWGTLWKWVVDVMSHVLHSQTNNVLVNRVLFVYNSKVHNYFLNISWIGFLNISWIGFLNISWIGSFKLSMCSSTLFENYFGIRVICKVAWLGGENGQFWQNRASNT